MLCLVHAVWHRDGADDVLVVESSAILCVMRSRAKHEAYVHEVDPEISRCRLFLLEDAQVQPVG